MARLFGRLAAWHVIECRANKAGDHMLVKLSGGRIVEATIKANDGRCVRLQVSFGEETALIYPSQIVIEAG